VTNCDTIGCNLGYCDSCMVGLREGMSDELVDTLVFECPSCFRNRVLVNCPPALAEPYLVRRHTC
jgi:hypothetical protein